MPTAQIVHYSDVLCVWAYLAQVRMHELEREFGDQISIEYRFASIFGSARDKLSLRWKDKGGLAGYGAHVQSVASGFGHAPVHPEVWTRVAPSSSMPAHLFLCAVRLLERQGAVAPGTLPAITWTVRESFFRDVLDVSNQEVLLSLAEGLGVAAAVAQLLNSGRAHAELAADLELAREQEVRVSPSVILNEGRQRLSGNVGYRVIAANVREILERPQHMQSWC